MFKKIWSTFNWWMLEEKLGKNHRDKIYWKRLLTIFNCYWSRTLTISSLCKTFSKLFFHPYYLRCAILGCDSPDLAERTYEPEWLRFTTPYREDTGLPRKCQRYSRNPANSSGCGQSDFNRNTMELCHDGWVFEDNENTIGTEVHNLYFV